MEFDIDSSPTDQRGRNMFIERFIHGEAYRARQDVNAVVHSHSPTVIPFSVTGEPLRAISHVASFLCEEAPVWDIRDAGMTQGLLVTNCAQGCSLAKALGHRPVALMRGHGNVVVAPDIRRAVHRALYTEVNARVQHWASALAGGGPIAALSAEEGLLADVTNQTAGMRAWDLWRSQVHL